MRRFLSYLVFKQDDRSGHWKLLGHLNAWGKYKAAQHIILISSGRPWLIIQGQGASGSGVALYIDRLFQVTKHGLREIVSYRKYHNMNWNQSTISTR